MLVYHVKDIIWCLTNAINPITRNFIFSYLIHCGLLTPYGEMHLGQLWFRSWLFAWWHQAITWSNVYFQLVMFCDIHMRTISQPMPKLLLCIKSLNIFSFDVTAPPPGTIETMCFAWTSSYRLHILFHFTAFVVTLNGVQVSRVYLFHNCPVSI